jgi:anti-sigma regulatory factor (Ser/Thr protein kinase)
MADTRTTRDVGYTMNAIPALRDPHRTVLRLDLDSPSTDDVAVVRRTVRSAAQAAGCLIDLDDLELIVSELAANVVLHAPGPLTVDLVAAADGAVRLLVHDGDVTRHPPSVERAALEETGRGLMVVGALAASWGWTLDHERGGKTVWVDLVPRPGIDA